MFNNLLFSRKGLSLIEIMIVVGITSLVGVVASKVFLNTNKSFTHTSSRIESRQEASYLLRTIEKEIRQISKSSDDFDAIEVANSDSLTFYADIDNDDKPEKIAYQTNSQSIIKTVTQTSNDSAPWEFYGSVSQKTLTNNYISSPGKPLFTYYSAIDQELASIPLNKEDRDKVKIIKVSLSINVSNTLAKGDSFETEVYLRNKNDPL